MTRAYRRRTDAEVSPYVRLLRSVADAEGITVAQARAVIDRFVAELPDAVWKGGRLVVPGLASFHIRTRKGRFIAHPNQAHIQMWLPETRIVACRISKNWRSRV